MEAVEYISQWREGKITLNTYTVESQSVKHGRVRRQDHFSVFPRVTTREIQGHLEKIYGVEVSPTLISTVTEAVAEEVNARQNRLLDPLYPIVYMDAIRY